MLKHSRRGGLLVLLLATTLAATACAADSGEEPARDYVQAIEDDPTGLNAQFVASPTATMFSAQILEPLIRLSSEYELTPGLAESWEVSDDGLNLTLHLRDDVKWHDGEPFTAEDVKFNFEEIIPLSSFGAPLAGRLGAVEIVDPSTVIVHLSEPYGPLVATVAAQFMVPKHVYEGTDYVTNDANMAPIGTGPMMFGSYSSGEQVVLVKNPEYWEGDVQVDRAIYPIMADANSRAEALFAGELDQAGLGVAQQERVSEDKNTQQLAGSAFPQNLTAMFNAKSEHLESAAVRAAVFSAIDRDEVVKTALSGIGVPANGFFPESLDWAVSPNVDFSTDFPHDASAINETLDQAGFERGPDGTRFTLRLRYVTERTEAARTAELVRSLLKEFGIAVELVATSVAVFTEKVYTEGDFDLAFLRSTVGADPSLGIVRWYACNEEKAAAANPSGICDPEIEQAAAAALDTSDQAQRGAAFAELQERAKDLMIYAPLAWFDGAFPSPSINTSRWQGMDEIQPITNRMPWLTMTRTQ